MASKKSLLGKTEQTKIIIGFAFVVALAIFIIASPITPATAQPPDVDVPRLRIPVTLDGEITGDEWDDANRMDVTFERDGLTYEGTIYLKHDCTILWMCIQVEDDDEDPSTGPDVMGDTMGVMFDANVNRMTDAGDDAAILVHDDIPMDRAITAHPPPVMEDDEDLGGVNNVAGASDWVAGTYTFELSKPLNSGDSAGYDIALSPGDEIGAMFIYIDPGETLEGPPFAGFTLSLEPCPVTISPTSGTVGSTVTVSGTEATANGEVRVYWGDAFMATTTASATGGYSVDIIVPDNRAGPMDISVRDVTTGDDDWGMFTVKPKITLIPDEGSVGWWGGGEITVIGRGFGVYDLPYEPWWAPSNVTIEFNGIVWTNITSTEGDGTFKTRFYVPDIMPSGTYNVNATDDLGNSASAPFTVVPKIRSWPTSGSTATHVHVEGWGFAASQSVTVTFDGIDVTILGGVMTDPEGWFDNWFKVPDVPDGIYTINATDALGNSASAPFGVPGPVMFLTPNVTVGSSIVTVTGFGFRPGWAIVITINKTSSIDLLYTGMMLEQTSPDECGSFEFSFIFPIARSGIYNVTANRIVEWTPEGYMKMEAETWAALTVVDLVMDKLIEMQGDIAVIQTEVGEIEVKLHNINATLLLIQDDMAVIQTDIGTIQADIALIQLNVTAINGNIATIQTTLGTIEGKITSIDGNIATIETDVGTVKTDVSKVKGAQEATATSLYTAIILALISAVGVIVLLIFTRRKPKS